MSVSCHGFQATVVATRSPGCSCAENHPIHKMKKIETLNYPAAARSKVSSKTHFCKLCVLTPIARSTGCFVLIKDFYFFFSRTSTLRLF